MTATKRYSVGLFGLPELEQQVLKRIFSLSRSRDNAYDMIVEPNGQAVDIVLIDKSNTEALRKMQGSESHGRPVVYIVQDKERGDPYNVRRPFTATRTLGVLDEVVKNEIATTSGSPVKAPPNAAALAATAPAPRSRQTPPAEAKRPQLAGAPNPENTGEMRKRYTGLGLKALVVDDSLPVRKQVAMALQRSGIDAEFAENGESALELVAENDYDIIFLDVVMPGADGYEVCKTIKRDRKKKTIPVIMLTGKSSPFDKVKGKLSGCDTYLTKPVSIKEFNQALNRCLHEPMAFESLTELTQ